MSIVSLSLYLSLALSISLCMILLSQIRVNIPVNLLLWFAPKYLMSGFFVFSGLFDFHFDFRQFRNTPFSCLPSRHLLYTHESRILDSIQLA